MKDIRFGKARQTNSEDTKKVQWKSRPCDMRRTTVILFVLALFFFTCASDTYRGYLPQQIRNHHYRQVNNWFYSEVLFH